jgi:hypothetical protein
MNDAKLREYTKHVNQAIKTLRANRNTPEAKKSAQLVGVRTAAYLAKIDRGQAEAARQLQFEVYGG